MADKRIDQLTAASTMLGEDLLVLEQNGTAKKLSGETLGDFLCSNVVDISATQPDSIANKIWITPSSEEYELVEKSEFDELKNVLSESKIELLKAFPTKIISNKALVQISDGVDKISIEDGRFSIEATQVGSGDPSAQNVREIIGPTHIDVVSCGKNLAPEGILIANIIKDAFGSRASINTTAKTVTYSPIASDPYPPILVNITEYYKRNTTSDLFYTRSAVTKYPFKTNTPYTIIFKGSATGVNQLGVAYMDGTNTRITSSIGSDGYCVFTTSSSKTIKSIYPGYYGSSTMVLYYDTFCVFEGVATKDDVILSKKQCERLTFNNPEHVYGGMVYLKDQKLVVTHDNIASYNGETLPGKWISSMDVYAEGATPTTGAQVVYELATPEEYPITITPIETLSDYDDIYTDAGDVVYLSYRVSGKEYNDEIFGELDTLNDIVSVDDRISLPFTVAGAGFVEYNNGQLKSSVNYSHTNFVDVGLFKEVYYKRAKSTSSAPTVGIAFYREPDFSTYISGIMCLNNQEATGYANKLYAASIPENAKYAVFSIYTDTDTYGFFELYGYSLLKSAIDDLQLIVPEIGIISTVADYYDLFDSFVDDGFATKKLLDTVQDLPIYQYDFTGMDKYAYTSDIAEHPGNDRLFNKYQILFSSGMHGNEKGTPLFLYLFMKRVCSDSRYARFLSLFDFHIVPIVNPTGYNANTRNNYQNININRLNESSDTVEAQAMEAVINSQHYDLYIDFHCMFSDQASFNQGVTGAFSVANDMSEEDKIKVYREYMKACSEVLGRTQRTYDAESNNNFQSFFPWEGTENQTFRNYGYEHTYDNELVGAPYSCCFETSQWCYTYSGSTTIWNNKALAIGNTLFDKVTSIMLDGVSNMILS